MKKTVLSIYLFFFSITYSITGCTQSCTLHKVEKNKFYEVAIIYNETIINTIKQLIPKENCLVYVSNHGPANYFFIVLFYLNNDSIVVGGKKVIVQSANANFKATENKKTCHKEFIDG